MVLQTLHENHPGIVKMKNLAKMHVWWLGIDQDIEKKVGRYSLYQNQQPALPKTASHPWIWPSKPWQRIQRAILKSNVFDCGGRTFKMVGSSLDVVNYI